MRIDKIDSAIIESLMRDGRKSFRQLAREIKVSTPTIETHFTRMMNTGIIKKIVPVFDLDKFEKVLSAFVFVKVNPSQSKKVADKLASISLVQGIFTTTGEYNLMLRVIAEKPEDIEEFVRETVSPMKGVLSVSYDIVARTIKEEQSLPLRENTMIKINCNYCGNEIGKSPKKLDVGEYQRYFCCSACLTLYRQKYKGRIEAITKKTKAT